jgi:formylglycine-generating enzyme required for sulfatase activity
MFYRWETAARSNRELPTSGSGSPFNYPMHTIIPKHLRSRRTRRRLITCKRPYGIFENRLYSNKSTRSMLERRRWFFRTILLIGGLFCGLQAATGAVQAAPPDFLPEKHMALVIGISAYAHWTTLPNAVVDARRMDALLRNGGFKTILVENPDSQKLKTVWEKFVQAANTKPESACLFYFAGHAATLIDDGSNKTGWIVPVDAPLAQTSRSAFTEKALRIQDLISDAAGLRVRHQLYVFDAAFMDDWLAGVEPALRLLSPTSGLPTRQILIAGDTPDAMPSPSRFTDLLINALRGEADTIKDGFVTTSELAVYLSNHLSRPKGGRIHLQFARSGDDALAKGDVTFTVVTADLAAVPTPEETPAVRPTTAHLLVDTQPKDAHVRILNIAPKFTQGMALKPGRYHLEVSAQGYRLHKEWVALSAGENKAVTVGLTRRADHFSNSLGMRFQFIPAGSFQMGLPSPLTPATQDEAVHRVILSQPFYMQIGEVTKDQFRRFVEASGYRSEVAASGGCWTSAQGHRWRKQADAAWDTIAAGDPTTGDREIMPVSCISWHDADAFTRWLSKKEGRRYRLPTEAQWEYACRSGSTTPFAFGTCLSFDQANFGGMGPFASQCPPLSAAPRHHLEPSPGLAENAWGLFHMHGNVAEWCRDFYGPYPQQTIRDPLGPAKGTEKVIRGGHYLSLMSECQSGKRSSFPPEYASSAVGFRLTAAVD